MTHPETTGTEHSSGVLQRMTDEQATRLKSLAQLAYERDAFKNGLDRAEAARRIAALEAKLRMLDEPPHTL